MSFATVAATTTGLALNIDAGGGCVNVTVSAGGGDATIVVVTIAGFEGADAAEEAVMVTTFPSGTIAGAV